MSKTLDRACSTLFRISWDRNNSIIRATCPSFQKMHLGRRQFRRKRSPDERNHHGRIAQMLKDSARAVHDAGPE